MKIRHAWLALGLLVGGCAFFQIVDTARMPASQFPGQNDTPRAALYEAQLAFSGNAPSPATPAQWARVLADVEYLAGALNTDVRYADLDGAAQAQVLEARREVRGFLGVPETAPSQAVVDALLAASHATDAQALRTALSAPIFTLGADATLARLQAGPTLVVTPLALAAADRAIFASQHFCRVC